MLIHANAGPEWVHQVPKGGLSDQSTGNELEAIRSRRIEFFLVTFGILWGKRTSGRCSVD